MKVVVASYAGESQVAGEEITMDIMDVEIDDWVAVTYENN